MKSQHIALFLGVAFLAGMATCNHCAKSHAADVIRQVTAAQVDSLLNVDSLTVDSLLSEISRYRDSVVQVSVSYDSALGIAQVRLTASEQSKRREVARLTKQLKQQYENIDTTGAVDDFNFLRRWAERVVSDTTRNGQRVAPGDRSG